MIVLLAVILLCSAISLASGVYVLCCWRLESVSLVSESELFELKFSPEEDRLVIEGRPVSGSEAQDSSRA